MTTKLQVTEQSEGKITSEKIPIKFKIGAEKKQQLVVDVVIFLCGEGTCIMEERRIVVPLVLVVEQRNPVVNVPV